MARVSFVEWLRRTGWAVLGIVAFLAVGFAIALGLLWIAGGGGVTAGTLDARSGWRMLPEPLAVAVGFVLATWLLGVRLTRRPWSAWGWRGAVSRQVGRGVLIGAVMAIVAVGLALAGGARIRLDQTGGYVPAALPLAAALLVAALAEELSFRGFPLQRLADATGRWVATAALSIGFALAHLGNPSVTAFGALNIALAGVWLAVAYFSHGGMGLAWGLHFGWNGMLALGFDAPVSGIALHVPGPEYAIGQYAWLDGGRFGPEGGLVGTVAMVGGTVYLLREFRRPAVAA